MRRSRHHRLLETVACLVLLGACATARSRGDEAFARGAYLDAADHYGVALERDPGNTDLRERRDEARRRALAELLDTAGQKLARHEIDAGLRDAERAMRRGLAWTPLTLTSQQQHALDEVTAASAAAVSNEVRTMLAAGRALGAEHALARRGVMGLPALIATRDMLRDEILRGGATRCRELQEAGATAEAPYWAELVSRYCARFGLAISAPVLPDLIGGFAMTGELDQLPEHSAIVHAWLESCLHHSVWFASGAPQATAALLARFDFEASSREVTLQAPWTEVVAYQVTESYQEPHRVSHLETESYTEYVSRTTYSSESYSCGYGNSHRTCTRQVPRTITEPVHKTRLVTRYRTEYRTAWRTVTRHRSEPRVFTYPAVEHTTRYSLEGRLSLDLVQRADPLMLPISDADVRSGVEHDATFKPAGVKPSRPHLPGPGAWLRARFSRLEADMVKYMNATWPSVFCRQPSYTLDEAARCLRSDARPEAAMAALRAVAGDDAPALAELAGRGK